MIDEMDSCGGRRHCPTHTETITYLAKLDKRMETISTDMKWYNGIGKTLVAIGMMMILSGIGTLLYFGKLDNRVEVLEKEMIYVMDHIQDELHMKPQKYPRRPLADDDSK